MTTAAVIAEQSTSLTISALGNTSGTAKAFISFATLVAAVAKHFKGNPSFDKAVASALAALQQHNFPEADLITAQEWLASRPPLTLSPEKLAQHGGDVPAYLQSLLTTPAPPKDGTTLAILQLCLTAAFESVRHNPEFHAPFSQAILAQLSASSGEMHRKQDLTLKKQDQIFNLLDQLTKSQAEKDALIAALHRAEREFQTTQNMLANFLRIILETEVPPDQFGASLMNFAAEWKRVGQFINALDRSHNLTPELSSLRAQAKAAFEAEDQRLTLHILKQIKSAEQADTKALDDHIAQAIAQRNQRAETLRETNQAILATLISMGDVTQTAELLIETLDAPHDPFNTLRAMRYLWYKRYQSHGVPFDGQVALALARATLARAGNDDEHGAAQNDLGNILQLLGQRAGDAALLNQAIDAYRAALRVYSETETPQDWAGTQNNLGGALAILGKRAGDTKLLSQAVEAFRAALWVYSEAETPQDWAMTQNNLGNALRILGQGAGDADLLRQAIEAFRAALRVYSQADTPQTWATTQNNQGNALGDLGELARDADLLGQAQAAYRAALRVYSVTDTPLDWAETTANMAILDLAFFDQARDPAHLQAAQDRAMAARAVYLRLDAQGYLPNIDNLLAEIARRMSA